MQTEKSVRIFNLVDEEPVQLVSKFNVGVFV